MKRVIKQSIMSATEDGNDALDEALSNLKDDFDYALSGIEKLGRSGAQSANDALVIAEKLSDAINNILSEIANSVE